MEFECVLDRSWNGAEYELDEMFEMQPLYGGLMSVVSAINESLEFEPSIKPTHNSGNSLH